MARCGRMTRLWWTATILGAVMMGLAACGGDARINSFPGPTRTASGVPADPTPPPGDN